MGGLLGTLPTTIVPAGLGLWAQDAEGFGDAMGAVPVGMLINVLFLWAWRAVPPLLPPWSLRARLTLMTVVSLTVWLVTRGRGRGVAAGAARRRRLQPGRRCGGPRLARGGGPGRHAAASAGAQGRPPGGPVDPVGEGGCWRAWPSVRPSRSPRSVDRTRRASRAYFRRSSSPRWCRCGLAQGEAVPSGAVGPHDAGIGLRRRVRAARGARGCPGSAWGRGFVGAWIGAVVLCTVPAFAWLRLRGAVGRRASAALTRFTAARCGSARSPRPSPRDPAGARGRAARPARRRGARRAVASSRLERRESMARS